MGLFLASCEKNESYLDLEKINGSATIQGVVTYNQGERLEGSSVVMFQQPLANAEVVVSVNYSEYEDGSEGIKKYTTTTDANGKFSIDIPVGLKTINAKVGVKSFMAEYYSYDLVIGETKVNAIYEASREEEVSLTSNDLKWVAIQMNARQDNTSTDKSIKVSVAGKVSAYYEKAERNDDDEVENIEVDTKAAENVQVIVRFKNASTNEELMYLVTTNTSGEYTVAANLFTRWNLNNVTCEVETKPYTGEFKHWYEMLDYETNEKTWKSQTVNGLYKSESISSKISTDNTIQTLKLQEITLVFEPADNCSIKGIGNEVDNASEDYKIYTFNPMDWSVCR